MLRLLASPNSSIWLLVRNATQYPRPDLVDAMPTAGDWVLPGGGVALPKKGASPKLKMPPSEATNQYPPPSGVAAIPTIGWLRWIAPVEPKNLASPKAKIPPSLATSQ